MLSVIMKKNQRFSWKLSNYIKFFVVNFSNFLLENSPQSARKILQNIRGLFFRNLIKYCFQNWYKILKNFRRNFPRKFWIVFLKHTVDLFYEFFKIFVGNISKFSWQILHHFCEEFCTSL